MADADGAASIPASMRADVGDIRSRRRGRLVREPPSATAGQRLSARSHVLPSRCVTGEDKVASLDGLVARKAGVVHRLVGGFAVVEVSEPPAAGRGVFS